MGILNDIMRRDMENGCRKEDIGYIVHDLASLKTMVAESTMEQFNSGSMDIDLSGIRIMGRIRSLSTVFEGVPEIVRKHLKSVNVSGWNVSGTETMDFMFSSMWSLERIDGLKKWDFRNVTDMTRMFEQCFSLKSIDFPVLKETIDMSDLFCGCSKLENVGGLLGYKVRKGKHEDIFEHDSGFYVNRLTGRICRRNGLGEMMKKMFGRVR